MLVALNVQIMNKTIHVPFDLKAASKKSINTIVYKFYYLKSVMYNLFLVRAKVLKVT